LARAYICRLRSFQRFPCPSPCPLLQRDVQAACTAARARRQPTTKRASAGMPLARAAASHGAKARLWRRRRREAKARRSAWSAWSWGQRVVRGSLTARCSGVSLAMGELGGGSSCGGHPGVLGVSAGADEPAGILHVLSDPLAAGGGRGTASWNATCLSIIWGFSVQSC